MLLSDITSTKHYDNVSNFNSPASKYGDVSAVSNYPNYAAKPKTADGNRSFFRFIFENYEEKYNDAK